MHEEANESINSYQQICPLLVVLANRSDDDVAAAAAAATVLVVVVVVVFVVAVFVEHDLRMLQKLEGRQSCGAQSLARKCLSCGLGPTILAGKLASCGRFLSKSALHRATAVAKSANKLSHSSQEPCVHVTLRSVTKNVTLGPAVVPSRERLLGNHELGNDGVATTVSV